MASALEHRARPTQRSSCLRHTRVGTTGRVVVGAVALDQMGRVARRGGNNRPALPVDAGRVLQTRERHLRLPAEAATHPSDVCQLRRDLARAPLLPAAGQFSGLCRGSDCLLGVLRLAGCLRPGAAALPGQDAGVLPGTGHVDGPVPGDVGASVPTPVQAALAEHLPGPDRPQGHQRLWDLPAPSVLYHHPPRARRGGAGRGRLGVVHLLEDHAAPSQAGARHAGCVLLHEQLERLSLAARRYLDHQYAHAPGRAHIVRRASTSSSTACSWPVR